MFWENSNNSQTRAFAAVATLCIAVSIPAAAQRPDRTRHDQFLNQGGWCSIEDSAGPDGNPEPTRLWPGGIVPYLFNSNVNAENQQRAIDAMAAIEAVCDVDFIPGTGEPGHIFINAHCCDNNSCVGYNGGRCTINISAWQNHGVIIHELGHSLGLWQR